MFTIVGNKNGLVLKGNNTTNNKIIPDTFYDSFGMFSQNRENGLLFSQGTHGNYCHLERSRIIHNGKYGLLLSGKGTSDNHIQLMVPGFIKDHYPLPRISNNQYGGVYIGEGAKNNLIRDGIIYGNNGNGVTINGAGTNSNTIQHCYVGGNETYKQDESPPGSDNQGYGIYVSNNAICNNIFEIGLGVNLKGGIALNDIQDKPAGNNKSTSIYGIQGGATFNYLDNGYNQEFNQINVNCTGPAILLSDCANVSLQGPAGELDILSKSKLENHDWGVYIIGPDSNNNLIDNVEIFNSFQTGLKVEKSKNDKIINTQVKNSTHHGIILKQSNNSAIQDSLFYGNNFDGILINKSNNINIDHTQSRKNAYSGMHFKESKNINISNIETNRNKLFGTYLKGSSQINISSILSSSNNKSGIYIENSTDINVDKMNSSWNLRGMLISDKQSNNIRILSGKMNHNQEEGIKIAGGSNIWVGHSSIQSGNRIAANRIGILAQGDVAGLNIFNNHITGYTPSPDSTFSVTDYFKAGIQLKGGISGAQVNSNIIRHYDTAILLQDGAHDNRIINNIVRENFKHGIIVQGQNTVKNQLSANSITDNLGKGIHLQDGGNSMLNAPVIQQVSADTVFGTVNAPDGSFVEIYADTADQGAEFIGGGRVFGKTFSFRGKMPLNYAHNAILVDPDGNTSEFGPMMPGINNIPRFAFMTTRDGNQEIYKKVGQTFSRLTNNNAADYSPALSPKGLKLAFVSDRSGNPDIWIGKEYEVGEQQKEFYPIQLTDNNSSDYAPAWSPDGSKLVFVSDRDGSPELYILDLAVENSISRLTSSSNTAKGYPSWSPDSEKIVFAGKAKDESSWDLYSINANGTGVKQLTFTNNYSEHAPRFMADGSKLIFISDESGNNDIWSLDLRNGSKLNLTKSEINEQGCYPIRDGVLIYSANKGSGWEIYKMDIDAQEHLRLTSSFGENRQPNAP